MTIKQNVSAEGELWPEQRLDRLMEALDTEEEKRSDEEVTMQEAEEETGTVEEYGMKKTKRVEQTRETEVKSKEVVEKEEQQGQNLDEHNVPDVILTKPILTAQNTSHSQEIEGEGHLPPTVNQNATPPTMVTAAQPVLNLHTKSVTVPSSFPSTSQGPAAITETLHTVNSTAEVTGATLLVNESSTNYDLRVELHVMNSSKLHPLEEVSFDATAMAARAGPTAKAPTFMVKSKRKPKDNMTLKAKKKKVLKVKAKKIKVTKKAKKVKKFKRERKLKPTTPPYFPYFKDHYCPSECSCYGRYASTKS